MNVLFLVPRIDKASTRYRVLQYLPFLETKGIGYSIKELSKKKRHWLHLARDIHEADVVFIQKKLFSFIEISFIRRIAHRIIFDLDDAIMFKDAPGNRLAQRRQSKRFASMARHADLIICGNRYLQEKTSKHSSDIRILPTPIDMHRYMVKDPTRNQGTPFTIGWIGSKVTLKYLKDISPALSALAKRHPEIQLKIVADDFFDVEGMQVIKQPWSEEREIEDLHSFDVGIMPLTDDPWARGKCGFKLLQCMAVGVPVICSPVGMNRDIVTDGVDGFWASSQKEWTEKLSAIIEDRELRDTMAKRGRKKVEDTYSLAIHAKQMIRHLKEAGQP
ncbi:glycosyltransferase [Syntrophotalea carbinolica DSM 2380]|uniref:Glycosyltransferase n=2 Tax=Syntrophotalea carbinolica TaxID=19 RepID=Q3A1C9_SYNC1|nr:glycosyltransferase [Syntrophotalea carbinolica DSM 2380]